MREEMKKGGSTTARFFAKQRNLEPKRAQSKSTADAVTTLLFPTIHAGLPGVRKYTTARSREN